MNHEIENNDKKAKPHNQIAKNLANKIYQSISIQSEWQKAKLGQDIDSNSTLSIMGHNTNDKQFAQDVHEMQILGAAGSVMQNPKYNDCWLEASLSAIAATKNGQKELADRISLNKDGSYNVDLGPVYRQMFPTEPNHITVSQDDFATYNLKNTSLWANIFEAAIIKSQLGPDVYAGSRPGIALSLLTNKIPITERIPQQVDITSLETIISENENYSRPMVAFKSDNKANPNVVPNGPILPLHAYSIVNYNKADKTIEIRNPMGLNHNLPIDSSNIPQVGQTKNGITNMGDGVLKMSITTFAETFTDITILQDIPVKSELNQNKRIISELEKWNKIAKK